MQQNNEEPQRFSCRSNSADKKKAVYEQYQLLVGYENVQFECDATVFYTMSYEVAERAMAAANEGVQVVIVD